MTLEDASRARVAAWHAAARAGRPVPGAIVGSVVVDPPAFEAALAQMTARQEVRDLLGEVWIAELRAGA